MRRLMYLTLGFGACCALFAYALGRDWLMPLMAGSLLLAVLLGLFAGKREVFKPIALVFLGAGVAAFCYSQFYGSYLDNAIALDGQIRDISVHVTDHSYQTSYGSAVEGEIRLNGKSYQVKAYLKTQEEISPGTEIAGSFRFRLTTPDGAENATYHQGRGIFLLLYQKGEASFQRGELGPADRVAVLRQEIKDILAKAFPADVLPFVKALLLGDTYDLSYDTDTVLKLSGIRHVVSVSGLHVSILFALVSAVCFRNRFLTALLGFPALLLFAALAGFSPSVTRSCLMLALTLLALLLEKDYDGPTALSFAVLVMLLVNPLSITDVGFQLSVASVVGIFAFSNPVCAWLKGLFPEAKGIKGRLVHGLCSSAATTLGAMALTTPLSAFYFGTVSLISVVTNLLTLPVISFLFYGILAVTLLGAFLPALAGGVGWLLSWPVRYVLGLAGLLARLPMAAVYTKSIFILLWLVFVYLLLAWLWLVKEKPTKWVLCLSALGLSVALLASWLTPLKDHMRFTVLDVGQGQCLLLQTQGHAVLVDCGGDSEQEAADQAAQTLLSQGISRLDALIVTHGDADHAGGVKNLLSRVDTELLILPQSAPDWDGAGEWQIIYPTKDLELSLGDTKISVFVPRFGTSSNENSLCVLFDTEKCDILITGDRSAFGERSLLRNSYVPDVDILIAGHHGSKTATSVQLLEAVKPEIVCISLAADNPYGHPAPEVLQRLEDFGCQVRRTDLQGDIIIRR